MSENNPANRKFRAKTEISFIVSAPSKEEAYKVVLDKLPIKSDSPLLEIEAIDIIKSDFKAVKCLCTIDEMCRACWNNSYYKAGEERPFNHAEACDRC